MTVAAGHVKEHQRVQRRPLAVNVDLPVHPRRWQEAEGGTQLVLVLAAVDLGFDRDRPPGAFDQYVELVGLACRRGAGAFVVGAGGHRRMQRAAAQVQLGRHRDGAGHRIGAAGQFQEAAVKRSAPTGMLRGSSGHVERHRCSCSDRAVQAWQAKTAVRILSGMSRFFRKPRV